MLTVGIDAAFRPLAALPPIAALLMVSLLSAIGMLLVVRVFSNASRIEAATRGMQAAIFEMRLFNDDLRALLRAQVEIFDHTGSYLLAALVPMLVLSVPFVLVTAQLDAYFGYSGLVIGQPALITAQVRPEISDEVARSAVLVDADLIAIETPAVWLPASREIVWRIRPRSEGEGALRLRIGAGAIDKTLRVSGRLGRRSPVRVDGDLLQQLRYPSEPPLDAAGPVTSIVVGYPDREMSVLGWRASWLVFYLGFTLVWALALRRPLRAPLFSHLLLQFIL